jgi:hypothetical protein
MTEKSAQKLAARPEEAVNEMTPPKVISVTEIVGQLEELVRYALECENKPLKDNVSFIEVYRQLVEVQKAINLLDRDQKELINLMAQVAGVPKSDLATTNPEDIKNIEKLKMLEKMCGDAQERIHDSMSGQREASLEIKEKIEESTTSQKKKAIHRKGKFKKMGGSGGWVRS